MFYKGISAELKAVIERLHTLMRNRFLVKKLAHMDFYLLRERREHDSIWHILIVDMPGA